MIIYYNPDCSKCQEAKLLLENNHCDFEIREYLKFPPSAEEISELLKSLNCKAFDLVRVSEPLYKEQFSDKTFSEEEWINILSRFPVLIERPIVITGQMAVIGRPPVRVLELINRPGSLNP